MTDRTDDIPPVEGVPARIRDGVAPALVALFACLVCLLAFGVELPRAAEASRAEELRARIESAQADTVLVGNSMLGEGVDEALFVEKLGLPAVKLSHGGSASAYWYLMTKNVVLGAEPRPRRLVLFFRDHFLTDPTYRVEDRYRTAIEGLAEGDEPLLEERAYIPVEPLRAVPGIGRLEALRGREKLRLGFERAVREGAVGALGPAGGADGALARVFADENMRARDATARQLAAEEARDGSLFEFDAQLPKSFLPEIVALCRTDGVELVLVRVKRRRDLVAGSEPAEVVRYMDALRAYLAAEGVPLVDFTNDPRIEARHFGVGDHLNAEAGRPLFTQMVAEALRALDAARPRTDGPTGTRG
jgi:hypothetical protein